MATPRDGISTVATDEVLLVAFSEQEEEFYGFVMEDVEMPMVSAVENSDEDHGSENEFNIGTVIVRIGENDQQNVFIPKLDGEKNLVKKEKPSTLL